jgi:hypothetical protein
MNFQFELITSQIKKLTSNKFVGKSIVIIVNYQ